MALLGELRLVEALIGRLEIGAGILPVGVEEQRIEAAVEVVVVSDVALRTRARIVLGDASNEQAPEANDVSRPRHDDAVGRVLQEKREHGCDVAPLHAQPAVHVELAEGEVGVGNEAQRSAAVGEDQPQWRTAAVANRERRAIPGNHLEAAMTDQPAKHRTQQPAHGTPSRSMSCRIPEIMEVIRENFNGRNRTVTPPSRACAL